VIGSASWVLQLPDIEKILIADFFITQTCDKIAYFGVCSLKNSFKYSSLLWESRILDISQEQDFGVQIKVKKSQRGCLATE
jgi:hypothetical protein